VTRTGTSAPFTGTTPVVRLISLNETLRAGRVVGAQRQIIHSFEIDRVVVDMQPAAREEFFPAAEGQ